MNVQHKFARNDIVYVSMTDTVFYVHKATDVQYEVYAQDEHYHRQWIVSVNWLNRYGRKIDAFEAELLKLNRLS